jgi:glutaconate CoA-transferase subunit A
MAAGMGLPYMPTRTLVGSDLARGNPRISRAEAGVLHVAPIEPDVAILQVQRADAEGHAHCWGNLGLSKEAGLAARRVILVAEEVVPTDVILSDPNRVLLPPHRVAAVVEEPGSAHPSPVQGYYGRDHAFYTEYHRATREQSGYAAWLKEWVLDLPDRATYLERLGARWAALKPIQLRPAAPVDYA